MSSYEEFKACSSSLAVCLWPLGECSTLAHVLEFGGRAVGQCLPQVQHLDHSQSAALFGGRLLPQVLCLRVRTHTHTHKQTHTMEGRGKKRNKQTRKTKKHIKRDFKVFEAINSSYFSALFLITLMVDE